MMIYRFGHDRGGRYVLTDEEYQAAAPVWAEGGTAFSQRLPAALPRPQSGHPCGPVPGCEGLVMYAERASMDCVFAHPKGSQKTWFKLEAYAYEDTNAYYWNWVPVAEPPVGLRPVDEVLREAGGGFLALPGEKVRR